MRGQIIVEKEKQFKTINLYCQDESRFGLFTRQGKAVTAYRVKPICNFQQVFQFTYLFGAYSPINERHFEPELPCYNSSVFQLFLKEFSAHHPEEFKIMVLDNGAFHKAKTLVIPDNIALIFLPPYSPELNPAEKIWWTIKRAYTGKVFSCLDDLSEFIDTEVKKLSQDIVKSICGFDYFYSCDYWTKL